MCWQYLEAAIADYFLEAPCAESKGLKFGHDQPQKQGMIIRVQPQANRCTITEADSRHRQAVVQPQATSTYTSMSSVPASRKDVLCSRQG